MMFNVLKENFLKGLSRVNRIVPPRPQLPVLQNVLVEAKQDGIILTTTNLETTMTVWVGGKNEEEGAVCVPARLLTELISSLPSQTVRLLSNKENLNVSCAGFDAKIPATPASEFPPASSKKEGPTTLLKKDGFVDALNHVLFAAANDEGRPVLTGVKLVVAEDEVKLVATDGYRLATKTTPSATKDRWEMLVPARALTELARAATEENKETIEVSGAGEGQLLMTTGDTQIVTRLLDGEYPAYEKIIPKTWTTRALIEKEGFVAAIKSAAIFARESANIVRLSLDGQKLTVSANAPQLGEGSAQLDVKIDGEGGDIAFNSRFLLEFLANFTEKELLLEMTGSLNPGVFRPVKDETHLHIIMPVRVQG